jgi:hypothetical protein
MDGWIGGRAGPSLLPGRRRAVFGKESLGSLEILEASSLGGVGTDGRGASGPSDEGASGPDIRAGGTAPGCAAGTCAGCGGGVGVVGSGRVSVGGTRPGPPGAARLDLFGS